MKKILNIEIDCGDKTCASKVGKFCKFVGHKKFGQISLCILFPDSKTDEIYTILEDEDGWIQRCQACLDIEK